MKTSNKILLFLAVLLLLYPAFLSYIKRKEYEKNPTKLFRKESQYYDLEKLKEFKHLKIIGNDSTQLSYIRFTYSDSCFSLNKKDNLPREFSVDNKQDTLIITLNKIGNSYWGENIKVFTSTPRLHLFAPALQSVSLDKIGLIINAVTFKKENASTSFHLNKSEVIMETTYDSDITHILERTSKIPYKSFDINGLNSNFELGNVLCNSLTLNLKGKSCFKTNSDGFKHFSGEISSQTEANFPERFKDSVKVIEEK
ncbi:hypothetical protein [Capnocytophaga felis]|uniref:Uncharacterized protein n=1 Tax=Capnocytophaga felis TaxID=2267611 RepID=A0A5M4BBL7_9FLAO|nr:hypothetical protein [Capnocytophaga felis]GET46655.1 hypothetical protein RCZ01_19570 [Capnocytophaga felis]GET48757.1 hypothetical protein RCZ02_15880 [Capnocytophaga felis]